MAFEKGKSYKTVGGWEAIYMGEDRDGDLNFCHYHDGLINQRIHNKNGEIIHNSLSEWSNITTEEWQEPRKGVVWVNVYEGMHDPYHYEFSDEPKPIERTISGMTGQVKQRAIARKAVPFTEGEYDE